MQWLRAGVWCWLHNVKHNETHLVQLNGNYTHRLHGVHGSSVFHVSYRVEKE